MHECPMPNDFPEPFLVQNSNLVEIICKRIGKLKSRFFRRRKSASSGKDRPASPSPVGGRTIALPISINGYELSTTRSFHFQGRGAGVGRGLGVGSNLGVGVDLGVAVGVSVAVGVEVAVGVTVAVDVAVGVGVGVAVGVAVAVGVGEPPPHNAVTVSV